MAYFSPYINNTGIHIPTYNDTLEDLIASMKSIFGNDIYIDEDSQDYQQISIFAKKIFDVYSLAMMVYNNRTAITAVGYGLDNMCAMAGITRIPATYSTVQLTIAGTAGTVISNGKASDGVNTWIMPASVVIPAAGSIIVSATCSIPGAVTAGANTITEILTPVYGWTSVTNAYSATEGINEESDAELRSRYALSTLLPSDTVFDGVIASLKAVEGVTRVIGYENDTNVTDANGLPPHSVSFIVEGGTNLAVATNIYYKKTPGCYTHGTTLVPVTATSGNVTNIRFYRPTYKNIYVKVYVTRLAGYNASYETSIKNAISEYINGLDIAEKVYRQIVMSVAISQMSSINSPEFSITDVQLSTDGSTYSTSDVSMNFNEAAQSLIANITLVVT